MNKKSTCLIFLFFFSFLLKSNITPAQLRPAIAWQKCLGGTLEDKANDVLINADGSFIVAGYSKSNDGDVTGHHGSTSVSDAWIVKLDSGGNIIWQKSIGGTGEDYFNTVIATNDNAYLCIGYTSSGDGDVSGNHGAGDVWVVKVNANGSIAWSKCYGGSKYDVGSDGMLTSDGGYAIIGTSYSYDGDVLSGVNGRSDSDGWVFKINGTGNIAWEKSLNYSFNFLKPSNLPNDIGYNITSSEDGNLYALASGSQDYQGGIWPYYDTLIKTPGKLYRLDLNNGNATFLSSLGGDSSFSMCKTQTGMYATFVDEEYFYPEFCFNEYLYISTKADGSNVFAGNYIASTPQCTAYQVTKTKFARTHGIVQEPSLGSFIAAGDQDKYSQTCCPFPTNAYLDVAGITSTYGGDPNNFGSFTTEAFRSVKVFPGGSDYIVAGNTNSVDGDVTGYHNGTAIGAPSDCWVVRLKALNKIVGNVFLDENNNGIKDPGELPFNSDVVVTTKPGFHENALPYNGVYRNSVDVGTFTTTLAINRPYYTATPASKISVFSTYQNTDSANFAVHAIPGIQDYTIAVASLLPVSPGFNLQYKIVYTNNGTVALSNKTVTFIKDSRSVLLGSMPAYTSVSGDTIRWNITSLAPATSGNIILNLELNAPPIINFGDVITSNALIDSIGDFQPTDNYVLLNQSVFGSFDPNDKQENYGGEIYPPDIAAGKYLNYTIRFQNSGNDTAFNIILRDTLDNKLKGDSIEIVAASHPYQVNVKDNKYVTVTFANIKLVDSIHNEPLSHGYFSYRIKPTSTLAIGDTIKNNASIYFDFNLPIKTNTQITIVKQTPTTELWTGAISTAWEDPFNWGNHLVPDENTNVIINNGLPHYPIISSGAVCRTIQVKASTNILVKSGFTLKVMH